MNFDFFLKELSVVGIFFEKTYAFWQRNIAVANVTHIAFGIGIALVIFTRRKKIGLFLIVIALAIHVIAFVS